MGRGESAALDHFSVSIYNNESKNKYSSITIELFDSIAFFFVWFLQEIYMYKVNLNIFWHLAQGTFLGGCIGLQFSTHFSMIKTKEIEDYSTQCCSNLSKNKKRFFFSYEFNISFPLIFRKWKIVLNNLTLGIPN